MVNTTLIFAIILGLIPSFAWLIFFLREDAHPEPKKMIIKVFLAGALISLLTAIFQIYFQKILNVFNFVQYTVVSFLILATIEEAFKFLAAYASAGGSKYFDEPMDAMIYMVTASLGFAAAENIFVVLDAIFNNGAAIQGIFGIIVFRFVGATLLHALSSSIVGYFWAKGIILVVHRPQFIIYGLLMASLLHGIFNYLILLFNAALIYPTVFLIIIALFVFWDFEKLKSGRK